MKTYIFLSDYEMPLFKHRPFSLEATSYNGN